MGAAGLRRMNSDGLHHGSHQRAEQMIQQTCNGELLGMKFYLSFRSRWALLAETTICENRWAFIREAGEAPPRPWPEPQGQTAKKRHSGTLETFQANINGPGKDRARRNMKSTTGMNALLGTCFLSILAAMKRARRRHS